MYMNKKNIVIRMVLLIFGLYLCGLGLTFFYFNGLGLDAWNVLHDGLSKVLNLRIGIAFVMVSIIMLILALLMGEKLGIGTISNALLIGNFMQFNIDLGFLKTQTNIIYGLIFTIVGMIITGFGYYFYLVVGLGAGPRDSFVLAMSRITKIKMGYVKSIIEVVAITVGYLIGGNLGIATVITAVFTGMVIQKVFDFLKFDPKTIVQENVMDTIKSLK